MSEVRPYIPHEVREIAARAAIALQMDKTPEHELCQLNKSLKGCPKSVRVALKDQFRMAGHVDEALDEYQSRTLFSEKE